MDSPEADLLTSLADFECLQEPIPKKLNRPSNIILPKTLQRHLRERAAKEDRRAHLLESTSGTSYPVGSYGKPHQYWMQPINKNLEIKTPNLRNLHQVLGLLDPCSLFSTEATIHSFEPEYSDKKFDSNDASANVVDLESRANVANTRYKPAPAIPPPLFDLPIFIAVDFEFRKHFNAMKSDVGTKFDALIWSEERCYRKRNRLCYSCGSSTHWMFDCELGPVNRHTKIDLEATASFKSSANSFQYLKAENLKNKKQRLCGIDRVTELGIAIFDTRDLYKHLTHTTDLITTRHYSTWAENRKPFRFGKSVQVLEEEFGDILKRLLYPGNDYDEPRKLILVGHQIEIEKGIMEYLGINLELAHPIIDIIDTSLLGMKIFKEPMKSSLHNLARRSGLLISQKGYHNAGNDASYTLRAMLMLITHSYDTKLEGLQKMRVEILRKVANDFSKWHEIHQAWYEAEDEVWDKIERPKLWAQIQAERQKSKSIFCETYSDFVQRHAQKLSRKFHHAREDSYIRTTNMRSLSNG